MKEEQIIQDALEQLEVHTGIAATVTSAPGIDGVFHFTVDGKAHMAFLEVKNHIRGHQLAHLVKLKAKFDPLMVIAEQIYPKMKEELRKENIAYLETNGNVFYKGKDLMLWIDGQKAIRGLGVKEKTGRAFTKTGVRLLFHFMLEPALLNLTYREIAQRTEIVFGNINVIMNDLKQQGFLLQLDRSRYQLKNKKELLERWMVAYEEKLKPALKLGNFRFLKDEDYIKWKNLQLAPITMWGAEPAADLLTNYLKPGELTLYTLETKQELIRNYRLIPDEKGPVKAYQKFWYDDKENQNIVHPLLVYVDLMNTGDRRCIETAQKIYEQFLQDKF